MSLTQKIKEIEEEINRTQKNKNTEYHLGQLKAKVAKLRREILEQAASSSGGGGGEGFDVSKSGDARVGLIGFPSVGKSTLLNKLTGTFSEVASYEFTTLTCIPGVIQYKGSKIQLLDLPGIIEGAKDGKGRGRQVIGVARTCSCILVVLDATKNPFVDKEIIERELDGFGIRLNQDKPNITFKKKPKGGINYTPTVQQSTIDFNTIKAIFSEYKIHNADLVVRCDATVDQIIDVIEGNRMYLPCLYVLNKIDQLGMEELEVLTEIDHSVPISANMEMNLDFLLEKMWDYLALIRVYTKPKGQIPDYESPVVLRNKASSVEDLCNQLHKGMMNQFKYALVWGTSVKHNPQKVGREHVLQDQDIIQIIKGG